MGDVDGCFRAPDQNLTGVSSYLEPAAAGRRFAGGPLVIVVQLSRLARH